MEFNLGIPFSIFTQKTQSLTPACDLVIKSQKVKKGRRRSKKERRQSNESVSDKCFHQGLVSHSTGASKITTSDKGRSRSNESVSRLNRLHQSEGRQTTEAAFDCWNCVCQTSAFIKAFSRYALLTTKEAASSELSRSWLQNDTRYCWQHRECLKTSKSHLCQK